MEALCWNSFASHEESSGNNNDDDDGTTTTTNTCIHISEKLFSSK